MKTEKLFPECKDYLWGGERLKEKYGKKTPLSPCAESWELSLHPDGLARLSDGTPLAERLGSAELGENTEGFPQFPVLIKFIDAKAALSVQVHPSDDYALREEGSLGKTEMWYIVEAEEGAGIYLGFRQDVTEAELRAAIESGTLTDLLHFYRVKAGDCFFIPSGTVHAIGAGCLICEIQQNSNLTYRVYDYGRRDKNGKTRELHIDKALAVADRRRYEPHAILGDLLGVSRYFTARRLTVAGELSLLPERSFQCLTCVRGEGEVDGLAAAAGDSFFVPADRGSYTISGNMEVIMTEIRKYYIGIDLGGTFIKGGIVDDLGNLIVSDKTPTEAARGADAVIGNIAALCRSLLAGVNMTEGDVVGIGLGVPGTVDSERGEVAYSNNLGWECFEIVGALEKLMGLPVRIGNDANVAALGETKFGAGRAYRSTVMFTLGTGVGGGIVIDGKLFEGNRSAGAELGHSVIVAGGEPCTCGRRGCLEAYASATALIRDTKRAMEAHPDSRMWEIGALDAVTGKTAFDYAETDAAAAEVVRNYIEKLGVGLTNACNELRPEAILLGGGVCAQGDALIKPLRELVEREIYGGRHGPAVDILVAELQNSAGILGAAALFME